MTGHVSSKTHLWTNISTDRTLLIASDCTFAFVNSCVNRWKLRMFFTKMSPEIFPLVRDNVACRAVPLSPVKLDFVIVPLQSSFEELCWINAVFKGAGVRLEVFENMSPKRFSVSD